MTPDATTQHFAPVLTVVAGLASYRLAYVGGAAFETVAHFKNPDDAYAALKAAREAVHTLKAIGA